MRTIGAILLFGSFAAALVFAFKQGEKKSIKNTDKKHPDRKNPVNEGKPTEETKHAETKPVGETKPTPLPVPQKDLVDRMFDLAFEKIRQGDLYKTQSDLKRGIIDTTIVFIDSSKPAKQKIKLFAEANKIPIENAIILELFPKK